MPKIYLAQMEPILHDKDANLTKIKHLIQQAGNQNADLILFPEMALTGYYTREKTGQLSEDINGPSIQQVCEWTKEYRIKAIFGFPERIGDHCYNSACFVNDDGTVLGTYQKIHLWEEESKYFKAGAHPKVWNTDNGKIGIMICYDTEFPETSRLLAIQGAEMILAPTANMSPYEHLQKIQVQCRAAENQVYVATTNRIGFEESTNFFGESAVADPFGNLLALADQSEVGLVVELNLDMIKEARRFPNYLKDRRPELYLELVNRTQL